MKSLISKAIIVTGLIVLSISFAQAQNAGLYRADIPFDFSVGSKQYAAGVYLIEVRGFEQKFIVLRDAKGKHAYAATTSPNDRMAGQNAGLDFQRVGDNYFLTKIRASDMISTFPNPKRGEDLARTVADGTVTVALSKGK